MTCILENPGFSIRGCWIPPFQLVPGKFIRIYIPNFSPSNEFLGKDLAQELAAVFQGKTTVPGMRQAAAIPYANPAHNRQNPFAALLWPITCRHHLRQHYGLTEQEADDILTSWEVPGNNRLNETTADPLKGVSIQALLTKNPAISFDYYGLGPASATAIDKAVHAALLQGKCAIGFDNLQFMEAAEPYAGFERIIVG